MPELTDAQKVIRNDTGKRMADALEALAGTGGRGLPAGGTDGDVLVKNGATDYAARWTKTPPQMGSLATIETSPVENPNGYKQGDFLVYNGQLYKVTVNTISQGQTLTPGTNISAVDMASSKIGNEASPYITITDLRPYTTPSAGYAVWDCEAGTQPVGAVTFGGFTFYESNVANAAIIMLVPKGAVVETAQANVVAVTFIPLT